MNIKAKGLSRSEKARIIKAMNLDYEQTMSRGCGPLKRIVLAVNAASYGPGMFLTIDETAQEQRIEALLELHSILSMNRATMAKAGFKSDSDLIEATRQALLVQQEGARISAEAWEGLSWPAKDEMADQIARIEAGVTVIDESSQLRSVDMDELKRKITPGSILNEPVFKMEQPAGFEVQPDGKITPVDPADKGIDAANYVWHHSTDTTPRN